MARPAPQWAEDRWRHYNNIATWWTWLHYVVGTASGVLAGFVAFVNGAAKAKDAVPIVSPLHQAYIAAIAAGLAFMTSGLAAKAKAEHYESGADILSDAVTQFKSDPKMLELKLSEADALATKAIRGKLPTPKV